MSRIGRMPIPLPSGVEVVQDGNRLTVKGPLGTLERDLHSVGERNRHASDS